MAHTRRFLDAVGSFRIPREAWSAVTRQQRDVFVDRVWFVTGSASGLGRNIVGAVLESGDQLVATARDPRRLDDLVNKFGERIRAVSLDVADESSAQAAVQVALDAFGCRRRR
jgi:NADP-dependent 3-hydroxy acid dehydrogenase YdfG